MRSLPLLLLHCYLLVGCVSPKSITPEASGNNPLITNSPNAVMKRAEGKASAISSMNKFCAGYGKKAEVTDMDDGVGDIKLHLKCVN